MELATQKAMVMAHWELIHEWLNKRVDHWRPEKEFHQYKLVIEVDADSDNFSSMLICHCSFLVLDFFVSP
ncbi:hypothetical protein Bca4012_065388 [Brassica carinata]